VPCRKMGRESAWVVCASGTVREGGGGCLVGERFDIGQGVVVGAEQVELQPLWSHHAACHLF
jgi:hypothetical protein